MSYLIAIVNHTSGGSEYPVNCFRTDLKIGNLVVIRRLNGALKQATVRELAYLNWECSNSIVCLVAEAFEIDDRETIRLMVPIQVGFYSPDTLWSHLTRTGWQQGNLGSRTYSRGFFFSNALQTAEIFFRRNGIDILVSAHLNHDVRSRLPRMAFSYAGISVRHFYSRSGVNLLEHVALFADLFKTDAGDYERFFEPLGSKDKLDPKIISRFGWVKHEEPTVSVDSFGNWIDD